MIRPRALLFVLTVTTAVAAGSPRAQVPAPAAAGVTARLQRALDEWRASAGVPGATLGVVLADGTTMRFASGVSDRSRATPMRADDLMLAGSTGKTFFAAVAVQLIESGRLELDARVSRYLGDRPWFSRLPNAADITVRHLMTHTSGLVRYEMHPRFTADLVRQPDKSWTPEEELAYLLDAAPPFPAGQGWEYSDTNYIVLGLVVEHLTKTPIYDEVRRRFLEPLRLTHVVPATSRRIPGLIAGYAGARDPLGLPDEVVLPDGRFVINPQFEWTGGGFATSAPALARWGHELYRGRALSPAARALMLDSAVPARLGPETRYGLGVIVRTATPVGVVWGHSGFFPGYLSELIHLPASGMTLAMQVNSSGPRSAGSRGALRALLDLAAEAAKGPR